MFSRFDTILECDRHTHRQTHDDYIPRLAWRRAVKINASKVYIPVGKFADRANKECILQQIGGYYAYL